MKANHTYSGGGAGSITVVAGDGNGYQADVYFHCRQDRNGETETTHTIENISDFAGNAIDYRSIPCGVAHEMETEAEEMEMDAREEFESLVDG